MKSLGFAINLAIIDGLYLLDLTFGSVVLGVFTLLFFGLEFLVPGTNKQRVLINSISKKQELLFWSIPMYPVLSRLYYNFIVDTNKRYNPTEIVQNKQKSFEFGYYITVIFLFNVLVSSVLIFILNIVFLYLMYNRRTFIKTYHLIEKNVLYMDDRCLFVQILEIIFVATFVPIFYIINYIDEFFSSLYFWCFSDNYTYKTYKSNEADSVIVRVDCGDCELIIYNYDSVTNADSLTTHVHAIMKDDSISFEEKQEKLNDYCRNRTYSIVIDNPKLVKVYGLN